MFCKIKQGSCYVSYITVIVVLFTPIFKSIKIDFLFKWMDSCYWIRLCGGFTVPFQMHSFSDQLISSYIPYKFETTLKL